jgi:hypothetical protein
MAARREDNVRSRELGGSAIWNSCQFRRESASSSTDFGTVRFGKGDEDRGQLRLRTDSSNPVF